MAADVLLYTTSWCPYCGRAKALLRGKGVQWTERDTEADPEAREAMVEASGRTSVPQIFINGTLVGGCDDLFALNAKGDLDKLLADTPEAH